MRKLTIIGCGKVGKTLGSLLAATRQYQIYQILNTTFNSSKESADFLNAQAVETYHHLLPADAFLLTVPDSQLRCVVQNLTSSSCITCNTLVFHCSGAISSAQLSPLKKYGAIVASIHPIKSFSDPAEDIKYFANTYCTIEGDLQACQLLQVVFEKLNAHLVHIRPEQKLLYHAATVFSSNYIVTLIDTALKIFQQIGINEEEGLLLLQPLMQGTVQQVLRLGPTKALTGPIARGDIEVVMNQLSSLKSENEEVAKTYQLLGQLTTKLANKKENVNRDKLKLLEELLG